MKSWLQLLTPTGDAVLVNKSVYVASLHFPPRLYFESFIIKFILRMFVFQRHMLQGTVACHVSFLWYFWQAEESPWL